MPSAAQPLSVLLFCASARCMRCYEYSQEYSYTRCCGAQLRSHKPHRAREQGTTQVPPTVEQPYHPVRCGRVAALRETG